MHHKDICLEINFLVHRFTFDDSVILGPSLASESAAWVKFARNSADHTAIVEGTDEAAADVDAAVLPAVAPAAIAVGSAGLHTNLAHTDAQSQFA